MNILAFLAAPFAALLILISLHTYFGIAILERRAAFAGLALAQMAALGSGLALLAGYDQHSVAGYVASFGLTVAGAIVLSSTRHRDTGFPRESVMAVLYIVAVAGSVMAMSHVTRESERLRDMLGGNLLAVSWHTALKTALLYAVIGLLHVVLRKLVFAPAGFAWSFILFASLGAAVTASVPIAGVVAAFTFLIAPALLGMLISDRLARRIAIGWAVSAAVSALSLLLAFKADLPAGPTIAAALAIALGSMAGVLHFRKNAV